MQTEESTGNNALPSVSIIVACRTIDPYVKECIFECLQLDYPRFDLTILPDAMEEVHDKRVNIQATGPVPPSDKRNLGAASTKGEVVAFIDGDAYPAHDWLRNAVKYFGDETIVAVGGPGLTPKSDVMVQQASGEILSSFLGAGPLSFRHSEKFARSSDDLPTVNMLVRRRTFNEIGGFDSSFWPGEDTKFCRDLVYRFDKKAVYAPDVRVYHHRRRLFREHLKQIAGYGLHRGYFSKKFPENSRRPVYFMPSLIAIGLPTLLVIGYFFRTVQLLSIVPLILYVATVAAGAIVIGAKRRNLAFAGLVFLGALATHLWYGAFFVKGLLSRKIGSNTSSYKSNIRYP